ncbi:MAG: hypothetical protein Q9173_004382 [Seirophora scorigena]
MSKRRDARSEKSIWALIASDALRRVRHISINTHGGFIFMCSLLPMASAQAPVNIVAKPNTVLFTPTVVEPDSTWVPDPGSIQDDVDRVSGWFFMSAWDKRGNLIRQGSGPNSTLYCLGNLSIALHQLGTLNAAEYNGAAGALSLLPTAGALIGSPTIELWVVYKLMPLAGILSVFLSLGGTMIPTGAGAYDPKVSFTYGGMIATTQLNAQKKSQQEVHQPRTPEDFAEDVKLRSEDDRGGDYRNVWLAIAIQVILIATILIALWFGQLGGVITWWCDVCPIQSRSAFEIWFK